MSARIIQAGPAAIQTVVIPTRRHGKRATMDHQVQQARAAGLSVLIATASKKKPKPRPRPKPGSGY